MFVNIVRHDSSKGKYFTIHLRDEKLPINRIYGRYSTHTSAFEKASEISEKYKCEIVEKNYDIPLEQPKVEVKQPEQPQKAVEQPKDNKLISIDEEGLCYFCGQKGRLFLKKYGEKMCSACANRFMESGLL